MKGHKSTEDWASFPPFQNFIGAETIEAGNGRSLVRLPFKPEIGNRKGDVHGGVLSTLADLAISQAIRMGRDDFAGVSTISLTVDFLDTATGTIIARGRATKVGRSVAFGEVVCEREDGTVVAHGSGAFRVIRHKREQPERP